MAFSGLWQKWFKGGSKLNKSQTPSRRPYRRQPLLDVMRLEDRILMSGDLPDLFAADAVAPTSAVLGERITVARTVVNQGEGGTPANWFDAVYLSDDAVFSPQTDVQLLSAPRQYVAAGASYTTHEAITLPTNRSPGAHFLLFVTDYIN